MEYLKHNIHESGHIEVKRISPGGRIQRHVIAPNRSIDIEPKDVQEAIKSDPNYKKYRTKENAEAYEKRLKEID